MGMPNLNFVAMPLQRHYVKRYQKVEHSDLVHCSYMCIDNAGTRGCERYVIKKINIVYVLLITVIAT